MTAHVSRRIQDFTCVSRVSGTRDRFRASIATITDTTLTLPAPRALRLYTMIPSVVSWSKADPENNLLPDRLEKRTFINHGRRRGRCVWETLVVLFLLIATATFSRRRQIVSHLGAEEAGRSPRNPAYLVKAKHGAVASENVLCSNIGAEILKEGGNAVDAAVATTFCVGVVNMFS